MASRWCHTGDEHDELVCPKCGPRNRQEITDGVSPDARALPVPYELQAAKVEPEHRDYRTERHPGAAGAAERMTASGGADGVRPSMSKV